MRKLDQLSKKLLSELKWRAQACMTFLMTEQKIIDDEHRMYPEHMQLLPWLIQNLPVDLAANKVKP